MYTSSGNHFLPLEIQRNIISRLALPSLKALRLASRILAAIGAEYLLPEVHLLYRAANLERLGAISRHPIIRQHVTTIFYEAGRLDHFRDRNAWFDASKTWLEYLYQSYPDLDFIHGFENHHRFCAEQQDIATRNLDHDQIARAIHCFPKLTHIYLSISARIRPSSNALIRSYAPDLVMPECEWALDPYEPAGVRQFTSLMLALCTPEKRDPCSPLGG